MSNSVVEYSTTLQPKLPRVIPSGQCLQVDNLPPKEIQKQAKVQCIHTIPSRGLMGIDVKYNAGVSHAGN